MDSQNKEMNELIWAEEAARKGKGLLIVPKSEIGKLNSISPIFWPHPIRAEQSQCHIVEKRGDFVRYSDGTCTFGPQ